MPTYFTATLSPPIRAAGTHGYFRFAVVMLAAIALVGYFVLPGWLSAAVVLLELASLCFILRPSVRPELRQLMELRDTRWMVMAFSAPLVAVTIVEIGNVVASQRRFEAPARLFLAAAVMLAALVARVDFSRVAAWVFPTGLLVCAAWVFHPSNALFYWDGRAATIFMDPISLSQHAVICSFVCAFLIERGTHQRRLQQLVLAAGFLLGLAVALRTESRTGWLIVPLAAIVLAVKNTRCKRSLAATLLVVIALLLGVYLLAPTVQTRIHEAVREFVTYCDGGDRDTSIGVRLSLFRTNLILFSQRPWLGWGFSTDPDILSIPAIRALYTPLFGHYWTTAGGHNEYLQAMMRMGLLGLASRLLLLVTPLCVFAAAVRSGNALRRRNGFLGLAVVIGYMVGGLTVEVLNLSYSSSFYALLVSLFAAGALPRPQSFGEATGVPPMTACGTLP
ncbi:O-antigen ligase family protein [Ramlibacter sp.]|uniref:O-antigen ligase family protein n=1 Tax=Ramlibacter sp. TaxID=1917967 RepID=UPI00262E81B7|nr:O-antigen ligase family protein [Ramlibacter sp.]